VNENFCRLNALCQRPVCVILANLVRSINQNRHPKLSPSSLL
jgi:hypothetical protein